MSTQPHDPSHSPVHICCLFDPIRARTLADPSSEDKAYVCSDIINACAEKTMADEFSGSWAQWTAAETHTHTHTDVARNFQCHGKFFQTRVHTLTKHTLSSQNVVQRDQIAASRETVAVGG